MPRFQVAHLCEHGQDMVIVPLASSFGHRTRHDQDAIIADLQVHAGAAGLAGTVVPVWDGGAGRMGFIAPGPWQSFFRSINLQFVARNVNRELSW
jgi:hypothetical protein